MVQRSRRGPRRWRVAETSVWKSGRTSKECWLLVALWGMFAFTRLLSSWTTSVPVFLPFLRPCHQCHAKVRQIERLSKIIRAVIPSQSPLPFFFSSPLNPSISYQSRAPGAASVPGAASPRLLLSFHHCLSSLILWPRLFRVSVCRGSPTRQSNQFHCGSWTPVYEARVHTRHPMLTDSLHCCASSC